jgi:PAS domain S-box-containing protein
LGDVGSEWPQFANLRSDNAEYVTVQQYLGIHRSTGVLVAGSRQTSFPSEQDRLVLHVAANQVAGVLNEVLRLGLDASGAAVKAHNRIVDAIPVMAWSTLPDGTADFFNGHFLSYLGVTTEQASGWGWAAALHPDDAECLKAVWIEMLASGRAGEAEARLRRWDGEYRWFLFRANPLFADDASIARWYGTNTDIDDRKRAEEGLRRSAAFLAQGQRLTETGSVWWRPATEEIVWSDEAYRVAGYPTTQIPTVDLMLGRCHPEDLPQVSSLVMRAMQDGEDMELEHRLLMPDGKVKYVYVVLQNIGSDPSDPEFIGAVSDEARSCWRKGRGSVEQGRFPGKSIRTKLPSPRNSTGSLASSRRQWWTSTRLPKGSLKRIFPYSPKRWPTFGREETTRTMKSGCL